VYILADINRPHPLFAPICYLLSAHADADTVIKNHYPHTFYIKYIYYILYLINSSKRYSFGLGIGYAFICLVGCVASSGHTCTKK
jgi:hypothetical protein